MDVAYLIDWWVWDGEDDTELADDLDKRDNNPQPHLGISGPFGRASASGRRRLCALLPREPPSGSGGGWFRLGGSKWGHGLRLRAGRSCRCGCWSRGRWSRGWRCGGQGDPLQCSADFLLHGRGDRRTQVTIFRVNGFRNGIGGSLHSAMTACVGSKAEVREEHQQWEYKGEDDTARALLTTIGGHDKVVNA